MRYRFYGDKLQLVKYEITIAHEYNRETKTEILTAVTDKERDTLIAQNPNAVVVEVDNTGYEWMDGCEIPKEEVGLAAEIGQAEYEKYIMESDPTYQMLDLDMRVALLEMGVSLDDISAD